MVDTTERRPARVTRRRLFNTAAAVGLGATAARWLPAPGGGNDLAGAATALRRGGTLRIAEIGEPPTLDGPATTATLTEVIMCPVFEGLFAFDSALRPKPDLAAGYTISADALTYTITLRPNVPFHNGRTMTADDVVASLNRWGRVSPNGAVPYRLVDSVTAQGDSTVVIKLKERFAPLLTFLAIPASPSIMPKELIEGVAPGALKQYVGTGPYRFVEWAPDRYVHLTRFDQYAGRTDAPDAFTGQKVALADDLYYYPVAEVATRIAGVQSGAYDIADGINQDAYAQLAADPRVAVWLLGGNYIMFVMNEKQGMMTNQKMRQAIEVALDMQPIMQAACGDPHLYEVSASMYPKGSPWYTTAGGSWYDVHNVDQAKALAKEAGYTGQTIRWLATQEYDYMFKSSVVAAAQLQQAGFPVDLQVVEWATLLQRRTDPATWDIFVTGTAAQPDPGLNVIFGSTYPGWWDTPEKNAAFARFNAEPDFAKRRQEWAQLHTMLYQQVPMIRTGNLSHLVISRKNLPGFKAAEYAIIPWNVQAVK